MNNGKIKTEVSTMSSIHLYSGFLSLYKNATYTTLITSHNEFTII